MARVRMAGLAKKRHSPCHHARMVGTVSFMAKRAVFHHWCMFPKIGPSFVRMALVAGLVDICPRHHLIVYIMDIVTARTVHVLLDRVRKALA